MQQQYMGVGETFNFQEIEVKGEKEYTITGYISTKSVDKFNDSITDECLDDMLTQIKSGSIKMDYEHETIHENDLNKNPIARIIDAKKDDKGLWVKATLNKSNPRFNEIWGSIKDGFLDAFSIAFKPIEAVTRYISGKAVRILNKLKLINVGITGTPVNEECRMDKVVIKAIKDLEEDDGGWEKFDDLNDEELEIKHKYIKRTGSPGHYEYFYRDGEGPSKDGRKHSDETEKKIQSMHQEWAQEVRQIKEKEAAGEITKEESKKKTAEITEKYKKESDKVESEGTGKPKESEKEDLSNLSKEDKDTLRSSERAIEIIKESGSERLKENEAEIKLKEKYIKEIGEPKTPREKDRKELLELDLRALKDEREYMKETFRKGIEREEKTILRIKEKSKHIEKSKNINAETLKDGSKLSKDELISYILSKKNDYTKESLSGMDNNEILKIARYENRKETKTMSLNDVLDDEEGRELIESADYFKEREDKISQNALEGIIEELKKKFGYEYKALNTQSGLLGKPEDHTSHSTSKEEDNNTMANEEKPKDEKLNEDEVDTKNEDAKLEDASEDESEDKSEEKSNDEDEDDVETKGVIDALTSEVKSLKSQLAELKEKLSEPEFKALQQPITKLKENVTTPLSLIG